MTDQAGQMFAEGLAWHRRAELASAQACYQRAIAAEPNHLGAWLNLGVVEAQSGNHRRAIECLRRALAIDPGSLDARLNLGNALWELGLHADAEAAYRAVLQKDPQHAAALDHLARLLDRQRKPDPAGVEWFRLAVAKFEDGLFAESLAACDAALARGADFPELHHTRGCALMELDRDEEALQACELALRGNPKLIVALNLQGVLRRRMDDFSGAIASYRQVLEQSPDHAEVLYNLGVLHYLQRDLEAAITASRRAWEADSKRQDAAYNMAQFLLSAGRLREGWQAAEARKRIKLPIGLRRYPQPEWLGNFELSGRDVFLHAEQGFGDTFQFIRYVPLVAERAAHVTVAVQDALLPLLRASLAPDIALISEDAAPVAFDCHAPLMSLPLAFGTELHTVPANVPYLRADPKRVARWASELGDHGFRVGVCWQSTSYRQAKGDLDRSFPLKELQPIAAIPGVRLISLHRGEGEAQLDDLPAGMVVESLGPGFDPPGAAFMDTAAVMQLCDLVITSDTSVAHLAGGLGVPVWLMLKFLPDWRWMLEREDSPWYPTMRLFRQKARGDWQEVFQRAATELKKHVRHSARRRTAES